MKLTSGIILAGVLALGLTACDKPKTDAQTTTGIEATPQKSTSEQIRSDIIATQQAMQKTSHLFGDQQKLQQQLMQAKTKADADKILQQQITAMSQMQTNLNALQLTTPEVQSAVTKIGQGVGNLQTTMSAFVALNEQQANSPETLTKMSQDMMNGMTEFFAGIDEMTKLAKEHGIAVNADAEHTYEEAKQRLQETPSDQPQSHNH